MAEGSAGAFGRRTMMIRLGPALPVLLGLACLIVGFVFALRRHGELGGWSILFAGVFLSVVWTGLMRVASQWALFLAPAAAGLIVLGWVLAPTQQ